MKYKRIVLICIILVIIVIKIFIFDVAIVKGNSMYPTLKNNHFVIYSKIKSNYSRFDIVIIEIDNKYYIKRVIGLPNETIEYKNNKLFINNKEVRESINTITSDFSLIEICQYDKIPENKFLVLGDNREDSYDSRNYGLIDKSEIKGAVLIY